jgi:predicted PurR-regulated permease PerM
MFILWIGRSLLLPIIMAVFFWYLTVSIASYYRRVIKSDLASKILSGACLLGVVYLFVATIQPMFVQLYKKMPEITAGGERILADLSAFFGAKISFAGLPNLQETITAIGTSVASGGAMIVMILVYLIFIFIEQSTFSAKLRALFPANKQFSRVSFIIHSIDQHMKKYLFVKTFVSFMQGLSTYLYLLILGVEFAGVWGFLQFLLNFIPTFGSIVATILPMLYVFAMTGDVQIPILIAIGMVIINLIFGNILDPKLTGKSLNLSPLAILINLVLWGMMWGSLGMFFSVPLLVGIYIVAAQFDRTRWLAILLSADGQIPDKNED